MKKQTRTNSIKSREWMSEFHFILKSRSRARSAVICNRITIKVHLQGALRVLRVVRRDLCIHKVMWLIESRCDSHNKFARVVLRKTNKLMQDCVRRENLICNYFMYICIHRYKKTHVCILIFVRKYRLSLVSLVSTRTICISPRNCLLSHFLTLSLPLFVCSSCACDLEKYTCALWKYCSFLICMNYM